MTKMISLEEARELVLSRVTPLEAETVDLLDAAGRVAAADLKSDIDVSPFAHAAMDGYAVRRCDLAGATAESPITLEVIDEVPAGGVFEGTPQAGQCVRIMTGAALPSCFDAVVKYEIVSMVEGDGKPGGRVAFSAQPKERDNVREAGEEARAGEIVVNKGEAITTAGVGFLAGCGVLRVPVYRKPRVAIIPIGSELVPPSENPGPGHIRNSNSYALAACAKAAGCEADMFDIVPDDEAALEAAVREAAATHDFVVTSGGASNGDFDFIKPVVERAGELLMTTVNMRPGKAQTFGIVDGTPVFGLPGNPAAAYMGFELHHSRGPAQNAGPHRVRAPHGYRKAYLRQEKEGSPPTLHARHAFPWRIRRTSRNAREEPELLVFSALSRKRTVWPLCPKGRKTPTQVTR